MSEETNVIKKWVQFDENGNEIGTTTSVEVPLGSNWFEIEEFSYGRRMKLDAGAPRILTDEEHAAWEAEILLSGALSDARNLRNVKLAESDWIEAAPLSDELKEQWRTYRQALRDLPESVVDYNVEWPVPPA
ncbi:MAG: phage tail assembly chaperone [Candidatus Nanopelagicaceae bacterium]